MKIDTYVTDVDIPGTPSGYDSCDTGRAGAVVLAPTDFQSTTFDANALCDGCVHQCKRGFWHYKGDEANMLIRNVSDFLKDATSATS